MYLSTTSKMSGSGAGAETGNGASAEEQLPYNNNNVIAITL